MHAAPQAIGLISDSHFQVHTVTSVMETLDKHVFVDAAMTTYGGATWHLTFDDPTNIGHQKLEDIENPLPINIVSLCGLNEMINLHTILEIVNKVDGNCNLDAIARYCDVPNFAKPTQNPFDTKHFCNFS